MFNSSQSESLSAKGHGQQIFHFFTDTKVVIERWL